VSWVQLVNYLVALTAVVLSGNTRDRLRAHERDPAAHHCGAAGPYEGLPCLREAGHELPHRNSKGWIWRDPDG
jgi:hypothetical protein